MLLIWGTRCYGKVDAYEGQYAMTRFWHVWFLPILPLATMWVTVDDGQPRGHERSLSGASVLHGYLQVWGPLIAAITLVAAASNRAIGGFVFAGVLLALAAATFRWRTLRNERARRRRRYLGMTVGSACDPLYVAPDLAHALRQAAARRWESLAGNLTPEDVARLGAGSVAQAAAAFTLLRLDARLEVGDRRQLALARSEQLLDATTSLTLDGAPYRAELPAAAAVSATTAPGAP